MMYRFESDLGANGSVEDVSVGKMLVDLLGVLVTVCENGGTIEGSLTLTRSDGDTSILTVKPLPDEENDD